MRIDLNKGEADMLISDDELAARRKTLADNGGYQYPADQTPWQAIQRAIVDQFDQGMVLKPAIRFVVEVALSRLRCIVDVRSAPESRRRS